MDRSDVLYLINRTYTAGSLGQLVPVETQTKVYCSASSVNQNEFFEAGRNGLRSKWQLTMFAPEYSGQKECVFQGERYAIYRTYRRKDETIELYLEERAGA